MERGQGSAGSAKDLSLMMPMPRAHACHQHCDSARSRAVCRAVCLPGWLTGWLAGGLAGGRTVPVLAQLLAPVLALLLTLTLVLALSACTQKKTSSAALTLPRADPAQVQWLERQSMLGAAPRLTALVSGTDKTLRASSVDTAATNAGKSDDRIDLLLGAADTWLWVHAPTLLTTRLRPVWEELAAPAWGDVVQALGVRGLYVAPTAESGAIWEYKRRQSLHGDDATSLFFAAHMGSEAQFAAFADAATRRQWQLGADLPPPATGLGPDFFLAARNVRDYPGTYMMLEAPEELWPQLPATDGPWASAALDAAQTELLAQKGILPPALARDAMPESLRAVPGGWAVTGEVRGVDGANRRWLYRYHGSPQRPQLHWDDPSGNARKIFSAAIIRQVGLLQHTVAALHAEALMGLDPVGLNSTSLNAANKDSAAPTLEPGPSALRDLGREVRRYGGWSLQVDELAPALTEMVLRSGVDFTLDTLMTPAAQQALRHGDAAPLRAALGRMANTDQRRMLRTVTGLRGPAILGAAEPSGAVDAATLARRHAALTLFQGGLPGLLMLSGQDLAGTLAPTADPLLGWSLTLSDIEAPATRQGHARAATLYPPVPQQFNEPTSYAHSVRRMTETRQRFGLARARVLMPAATGNKAVAGLWLALPHKGHALILANFSPVALTEKIALPAALRGHGNLHDVWQGSTVATDTGSFTLELAPYQCRWLVME